MKYTALICWLLVMAACKKEVLPENPDFRVKTASVKAKAGQEITFGLEGNAGIIAFYSGEEGKRYTPSVSPDTNKSIAVKGNSDARQSRFLYTYAVKGTYEAVFVARNVNIYGMKETSLTVAVTVAE
ncbi:DUF5017 domain-containing protein [Chitinophaga lutea]